MRLYNYLTREIERFTPIKDREVSLYTCGPTVYNYAHIGNLRTYLFEDLLKRTLEYLDYDVHHIMNITDIEDKIVKKARAKNVEFTEITSRFTKTFREDLSKLNILPADNFPTVTGHIPKIIELIQTLIDKRHAYVTDDGSVYFDISSFTHYGKLAQLDQQSLKEGASERVLDDEYNKAQVNDFVLWKAKREANEPSWPSPWGQGRPGWHIECSVLSMEYLGPQIDIHAGAVDLIFPHHTNEIAQSEAASGKKFVNYWLEGEHLLIDGKKMSKSKGNYYTLRDIEEKGFDPLAFRYLTLQTHYRKKLNFTWEALEAAQAALKKIETVVVNLKINSAKNSLETHTTYATSFHEALQTDLNVPQALATTWSLIDDQNVDPATKLATLLDFDRVLGLQLKNLKTPPIPEKIRALLEKRETYREQGSFNKADEIRKEIEAKGFTVEDTPQGPVLKVREQTRNQPLT